MSQEHITISPLNSEKKSKNFNLLREEGISYLQQVVGKIWTDYNVHDPGVTILEQVCYALTDLAYRANLDVKDILAINEEDPTTVDLNNFHTAREIMMNAPWTVNDYRKLIIDVDGIKNAWLEITRESEVDFYFDSNLKEITYTPSADTTKIDLNGLYEVLLEFDESDEYGDLNDNTLTAELIIADGSELDGLQLEISVEFPYWSHEWPEGKGWDSLEDIKESIISISVNVDVEVPDFEVSIQVDDSNTISVDVAQTDGVSIIDRPDLATIVEDALLELIDHDTPEEGNLLVRQQEKVEATFELVDEVKALLHENRNLCEDFVRFSALKVEEIVLCADIELEPEAVPEEVLAQIFFEVGLFLSPNVNFYSFAELLEKDKTTEEIFQGPRLNHGFIDDDELEASSRRKSIHVSDLINIIMDIEGVVAIKEIEIGNIPLGDSTILSKSAHWCLDLAWEKNFVPRLTTEKSKVKFYKKGIPFVANEEEVEDLLDEKKDQLKQDNNIIPELDLPVPNGDFFYLEDYASIQIDFPENYGVGEVGLPESATDLRKAQAKQLKGFLLFFDQFLANYCSQLAHIKELFSMNSDIDRTYFNQALYEIPDIEHEYKDFIEFAGLSNDPDADPDNLSTLWETFKQNASNTHRSSLNTIIESEETFLKRRNEFLDHLMARFCEQFTDYAMLVYRMDGQQRGGEELIEDKLAFLQDYPEISYNRGQGFNYLQPGWDNDNVSGFQKRVSRLLGIDNYDRRNLACPPLEDNVTKYSSGGKAKFRYKNYDGVILLQSVDFDTPAERNAAVDWFLENGTNAELYNTSTDLEFSLLDETDTVVATSPTYADNHERDAALEELLIILEGDCSGEGFYLVEHLLLRPRSTDDNFIPVSFEEECYCEGNEDAYSFRATCVMPYWIGRFTNMDFRNFVERTLREEAPAHIFLKICWVNQEQMSLFQVAYKEWLEQLENCPPDQPLLTEKQNNLIDILYDLRNVYPVSYLYDCKETENPPVTLGQSILGTFIPEENE